MVMPATPVCRPRDTTSAAEPGPLQAEPPMRRSLWERVVEPYAASMVLEDLVGSVSDPAGSVRILARFAVVRTVLLVQAGDLEGTPLRVEAAIARRHLRRLPATDRERRTLHRLLRTGTTPGATLRLVHCAYRAAGHAAAAGHHAAAFRLHSFSYMLALAGNRRGDAARAARSIARAADRGGAPRSARLWRARAARIAGEPVV